MKTSTYLFKGVTTDILRVWAEGTNDAVRNYVERVRSVDAVVDLTLLEAMEARRQIHKFNKECGTKLRLLKMKK